MPHRDTSVAIEQAINQGSKCLYRDTSVAIEQAINRGSKCLTGTQA